MLDRGEVKDWFGSTEIWIEATIAGLAILSVHGPHGDDRERSFLNRELLKSGNFVAGTMLMFTVGLIMTGCLALLPTMLQHLMDYPAFTTGLVTVPRGVGVMVAMFVVGRLINRIDNRLIILVGFLLTAVSMWQMTQFSLQMGPGPVIISGLLQGFGLGCTFVPLNMHGAVDPAAAHPDPGHRDPQPDAQSRRQHRDQRPGRASGTRTRKSCIPGWSRICGPTTR